MAKYLRMPRTDAVVAAPLPISNKKRRFTPANGDAAVKNQKQKLAADAATGLSESERSMEEFEMLNKIGEGAYGVVFRARDTKTSEIVAVKKGKELAETNILSRLNHPSIVDLKHCISSVYLVMEYAENEVRSLLETMKLPFSQSEVKCLMQQLLQGVAYLHRNQVIHRDLKTSNLLLNNRGELKICDFGMACRVTNIDDCIVHTDTVVTLWYRAPELLLGAKEYSAAIDMWAVGCIMAELLSRQILFDGVKETDQLGKIFKVLGSPSDAIWPGFSNLPGVGVGGRVKGVVNCGRSERSLLRQRFPAVCFTGSAVLLSNAGFDLLSRLLSYDPRRRITAEEALDHAWFREVPLPKSKDFMPTFPPNYARTRRDLVLHQQLSATGIGLFGL